MASHLLALLLFSALVSTVFATLLRDDLRSRLRFGAILLGAFVLSAVAVGWLMYPFPN
jgi:heme A synthase